MLTTSILLLVLSAKPTQDDALQATCKRHNVCAKQKNDANKPRAEVVKFLTVPPGNGPAFEKLTRLERGDKSVFPPWASDWMDRCESDHSTAGAAHCQCLFTFAWAHWDEHQLPLVLRNVKLGLYVPEEWFTYDDRCFERYGRKN